MKGCVHKPVYKSAGLLFLRLALGSIFMVHGYQKLTNIDGTTAFFDSLGIPMAGAAAWLVGLAELMGGGLIALGIFTCISAGVLAVDMLVAMFTAHADAGLTGPGGKELPLALLGGLVALMGTGSGRWSVLKSMACGSYCADKSKDGGCACGGNCGCGKSEETKM